MPEMTLDPELNAIQSIISALEPLSTEARQRVIAYIFQRLGLAIEQKMALASGGEMPAFAYLADTPVAAKLPAVTDIRTLKEQKAPSTAIEMAALVAFYISELASPDIRKDIVFKKDIDNYFKQANFPLPKESKFTLPNAAKAGYFDALGNGQYRLNPVGYNLVAHGLPAKRKTK